MKLTTLQQQKVDEIVSYFDPDVQIKIEFQAPTGSGKTLMATNVISELISNNQNEKFLFIIATLSSSELPRAFKNKIESYKKDLVYSKFDVEHIESPSNTGEKTEGTIKLLPERNKVYIFGKSTFGKNRIFTERKIIEDFISIAKDQHYKIIYIRDEAHVGLDEKGANITAKIRNDFEKLMKDNSAFIVEMTATPDFKANSKKVILTEAELNDPLINDNKWLIKSNPQSLLDNDILDRDLLEIGLLKFKEVQKEYSFLSRQGVYIRPALLIQVDNEPSNAVDKEEFFKEINYIKKKLNSYGFSWVKYFGDSDKESNRVYGSNFSLNDITNSDSDIDVIIFKVGPSTGWDIPRACMLLQLRNVSSIKLNTQTIGRIKRNPYPNLEKHEVTDKYYVYSNVDIDKTITIYNFDVKKQYTYNDFAIIRVANFEDISRAVKSVDITKDTYEYLLKNKTNIITIIKSLFINDNGRKVLRYTRYKSGGKRIYTEISNVFILLREIKKTINNNMDLYSKIKKAANDFYKKELSEEPLYMDDTDKIQYYHLIYVLLQYNKADLLNFIRSKVNVKPKYKVVLEPYRPENYVQVISGEVKNTERTDYLENYLFDIKKNHVVTNIQPLDSEPEEISFSRLRGIVSGLNEKVNIWAKNITTSNLSADFIDTNNKVRKSYFDYVVKFNNGAYLYIESKSKQDIDEGKTQELIEAYKGYFINNQKTLFDVPLVISLWIVDKDTGVITHQTVYDRSVIKSDLEKINVSQLITSIANESF